MKALGVLLTLAAPLAAPATADDLLAKDWQRRNDRNTLRDLAAVPTLPDRDRSTLHEIVAGPKREDSGHDKFDAREALVAPSKRANGGK